MSQDLVPIYAGVPVQAVSHVNRYQWTASKLNTIRRELRADESKWPFQLNGNKITYQNKRLLPQEKIPSLLKKLVKDGAPISIEGLYNTVYEKYWGVSRRAIAKWLKDQKTYQILQRRPAKNTRRNTSKSEGSTNWMRKFEPVLGVDLFALPDQWSKNSHLLVVVHRTSRYTWAKVMQRPTAGRAKAAFRTILRDCTEHFGKPKLVVCDAGGEFAGKFLEFLNEQNIRKRVIKLVSFVEAKNSTLGRYISYMLNEGYKWKSALSKSIQKVNNIKSRITKQRPIDIYNGDVDNVTEVRRKLKAVPKSRAVKPYTVNSKARVLQKKALRKNDKFYKSYRGYKAANWSVPATITKRRKQGRSYKYYINGKWIPHSNVQQV